MKGTSDDCLSTSTVPANTTPEIGPFLIDAELFEEAFEAHQKRGDYELALSSQTGSTATIAPKSTPRSGSSGDRLWAGAGLCHRAVPGTAGPGRLFPSARLECARRRTRPPHNPTARPTSAVAAPTCTRPARKRAAAAPTRCGAVSGTAPRAGHRGAPGSAIDTRVACCGSGLGDGGSLEAGLGRAQGPPEGGLSRGKDIK